MELYLLYEQYYGCFEIIGIYDNKEKAKDVKNKLLELKIKEDIRIERIQLNQLTDYIKSEVTKKILNLKEILLNELNFTKFKQTENGKWEIVSDTKRIDNKDEE